MRNRVPEVTLVFWIIKVLSTTTGETFADFLNSTLGFGLTGTTIAMGLLLVALLIAEFSVRRYTPPLFWSVVVVISIFGTLVTDNLTDGLGVPLWISTVVFAVLMGGTFAIWYARERTLSIHSIYTRRREGFYWVVVLFTFALGTAAGDFIGEALGLGYWLSLALFVGLIAAIAVAWRLGLNSVFCFWAAYVLTRPLGASLGDLLSSPKSDGGLGLGTTVTSVTFLVAIVALVIYLTVKVRAERRAAETIEDDLPDLVDAV
ncbi:membrane protein [Microbacterium mangrovi]|uniref:Membrane protein n=1 Tax=Microbacterium mangrovi TaxID=1348253 RepID=A0A0B2A2P4_9MICO|nr:membrane protein [Microbacterium mangrovi]